MRARIVAKSSAARGRVTFPPFLEPVNICGDRAAGARAQYVDLRHARRLVPAINGSIPEAPGGGHSSQDGTVLDAAAGDTADDDAPTLAGAVDVVTAGDVEVEGVVVIAGKLTAPRS
jgi:hypothetical protein